MAGRVALITGASQGIGAACAEAFRRRGVKLALTARNEDRLRKVGGPDALILVGDITDPEVRKRAVEETVAKFRTIDILVNNAGVGLYSPAWKAYPSQVRELFDINVFAPLEMAQLAVPHMRRQKRGMIVNISSIAGKITLPWFSLYSASKYALGSLTDGLRMELKRDGIHAMTVCPGYVRTDFQSHVLAGTPPESMRRSRPWAISAEDCAAAIVRGIERNARTVVTPAIGWAFILLERLMPSLIEWQLERMQERQP